MKKKIYGYGIGFLIIGFVVCFIWRWSHTDNIEPVYQWFQSLREKNIEVVSWGERTLTSDEKTELIRLIHSIPKSDIQLADEQGDIGNGSDYCICITDENETYQLWHSFIVMADVMITYKDYDYWIQTEELRKFLEKIDELDRVQIKENTYEEKKS